VPQCWSTFFFFAAEVDLYGIELPSLKAGCQGHASSLSNVGSKGVLIMDNTDEISLDCPFSSFI